MRVYLKRPNGKRKTFSLYNQVVNPNGSTTNVTIQSDEIESLNTQLKQNKITYDEALEIAKRLCKQYNIDLGVEAIPTSIIEKNETVLMRYWKYEYTDRNLECEKSALDKLKASIRALGSIDISTAKKEDIAYQIKSLNIKTNVKRMYIGKLNQILKFLNRGFQLRLPKEEFLEVKYLTLDDLNLVLNNISNDYQKLAILTLFHTGLRASELMALDHSKLLEKSILINSQYDFQKKKFKQTKNRKIRKAYILYNNVELIKEWIKVKDLSISVNSITKSFSIACKKTFPTTPEKHCSLHSLRHSYAILLARSVGLFLTAQSIGDSTSVTEKYYTGFLLQDESIELIDSKMKSEN
ncbi:MAG: tyrosine-type recombinase/integrase [Pseudobdellovibrio sp.]